MNKLHLNALDCLLRGVIKVVCCDDRNAGGIQNSLALRDIGALKTHNEWHGEVDFLDGLNDAICDRIALMDGGGGGRGQQGG
jgi:hypothetical protein